MESVDRGAVMIKGLASKKYICMDRKTGEVVAKVSFKSYRGSWEGFKVIKLMFMK